MTYLTYPSVADPGLLRFGPQPQGWCEGGDNLSFGNNFSKTARQWKKLGRGRGRGANVSFPLFIKLMSQYKLDDSLIFYFNQVVIYKLQSKKICQYHVLEMADFSSSLPSLIFFLFHSTFSPVPVKKDLY